LSSEAQAALLISPLVPVFKIDIYWASLSVFATELQQVTRYFLIVGPLTRYKRITLLKRDRCYIRNVETLQAYKNCNEITLLQHLDEEKFLKVNDIQ
jgi:hypothetical protein